MDYNVQEGIKKAMNFDGTVDEWVYLVSSLNLSDTYNLTKTYYFLRNDDSTYELRLRNKKYPIKSGESTKVMMCELVREGNYTKMNVSVMVENNNDTMKYFSVTFDKYNSAHEFLEEFLNKFNVKKLYVDSLGLSRYLLDYLKSDKYEYSIDEDNNVIKNNLVLNELSKIPENATVTMMTKDAKIVTKSTAKCLSCIKNLDEFKFLSITNFDDEYIMLVSTDK